MDYAYFNDYQFSDQCDLYFLQNNSSIVYKDEIKENILKIFWRSKLVGEGWQRTEQWGDVFFVGIEFEDGYASVQCFKSGYLNVMTILEKVI